MSWLFKLLGGWGNLKELVIQLLKAAKNVTANVRQGEKDKKVDDAIAAVRDPAHRMRKRKPKQRRPAD